MMASGRNGLSIFQQALDRAAAVVYFLGAVVPLGALLWLWLRESRPSGFDLHADWVIATLGLIGALTLLSFFALRRLTRAAMHTIDTDNQSQSRMLAASRTLVAATDANDVHRLAAAAASSITFAMEGFVFARGRSGELEMRARSGGGAGSQPPDADLAGAADESLRTMMLVARQVRIGGRAGSVIAVPCITAGSASSALLVWLPEGGSLAPSQLDTLSTLGSLTSIAVGNAELRESERNFFTHVTNLLVATLDRYLDDRSDHSRRVAAVANQISHALQLPERQRERLHFAALLHDIGMLQIPRAHANDRILARRHVEAGDEMLRPIRLWEDLAPLVRHHHEHWDGGGYPDGLSGDRIPLESRIIAVAEAFDAMTAEKSYKPAIAIPEALDRLEEAAGSQFDPDVVKAFVSTRR